MLVKLVWHQELVYLCTIFFGSGSTDLRACVQSIQATQVWTPVLPNPAHSKFEMIHSANSALRPSRLAIRPISLPPLRPICLLRDPP